MISLATYHLSINLILDKTGSSFLKVAVAFLILAFPVIAYPQSQPVPSAHQLDSLQHLAEVTVIGNTERRLKESPGNITVVDAQPFYHTNITPVQLLRQTSGIKVKQDGGYGSRVEFFINGSTGKQLKFFLDGLPLDHLGETQGLNNLPVEQIQRLEIYKGVLPVELGADALGGAINIVTRKERQNYLDASYALSSFGTHRLNLGGKKYWSEKFYTSVQTVYGRSKNNYTISTEVPNQFGNLEKMDVRRFHDRYQHHLLKAEAGWLNTGWADQLVLTLGGSGLSRQLQNNLTMTQPYGKATYREALYSGVLKYHKAQLFKHLDLTAYLSYNHITGVFTDTSRNIYTWDSKVVDRRITGGEITASGSDLHLYTRAMNQKILASYPISDHSKLVFSNTLQQYHRTGKDTVAQRYYNGTDFFGTPSTMVKNVAGLGFEGAAWKERLKVSTAIKHFYVRMSGYQLEWTNQIKSEQTTASMAFNAALAYSFHETIQLKASYERATRLPDVEEAFGDLMLVKSNPTIQPERSHNANLNLLYHGSKLEIDLSGFFKQAENLIYLRTSSQSSARYENLLRANLAGVEMAVLYRPTARLTLNANATYQDLRNRSLIEGLGINQERYKNARLPNIPYLLANAGVSLQCPDVLRKGSQVQLWWNASYTQEYFLYWEVDGAKDLKNRIPTQLLQHVGISFSLNQRLAFTLESNNILNAKTYDNFKVQLPGRSFSLKTRFYLVKPIKTHP